MKDQKVRIYDALLHDGGIISKQWIRDGLLHESCGITIYFMNIILNILGILNYI